MIARDGLAGRRFERALTRAATRAGAPIVIEAHREIPWTSATFRGARHEVEAHAPSGAALTDWLERIGEEELGIPGHIVAELAVRGCARDAALTRFSLSGLTVACP